MRKTVLDELQAELGPKATTLAKLSDSEAAKMREWVDVDGVKAVAHQVGVARLSIASAIAGLPVHRGTVRLIQDALAGRVGGGK